MATAPVLADLEMWVGLSTPDATTVARLTEALAAARADIEERCDIADADYPQAVRTAVLIAAHRIYNRSNTPEGVAAFGEFGTVRVTGLDADVERLIGRYLKVVWA